MELHSIGLYKFPVEDLAKFIASLKNNQTLGSSWLEDNNMIVTNVITKIKG